MKDAVMSRRGALRAVLSLGCGLLLPAVIVGCDTKPPEASSTPALPDASQAIGNCGRIKG